MSTVGDVFLRVIAIKIKIAGATTEENERFKTMARAVSDAMEEEFSRKEKPVNVPSDTPLGPKAQTALDVLVKEFLP